MLIAASSHSWRLSPEEATRLGVVAVDAETLLREADIISLHAPATSQTTGYFNAGRLATMRPHAVIVNSARGQLIVEDDLAHTVTSAAVLRFPT